jgi:diguanylate cyclase (GGDEF)-like protein/PAS domain S-box-containing protein
MQANGIQILLVENDKEYVELILRAFESYAGNFNLAAVDCLQIAKTTIASRTPDLVIANLFLPDGKGTDLVHSKNKSAHYPVLVMTGNGNEKIAVEAMKAGALDYVVKSEKSIAAMPHIAARALREWNLINERRQIKEALQESEARYRTVIDQSPYSILIYTPDGQPLSANPASRRLWNIPPEGWAYFKETYNVLEDSQLEAKGLTPYLEKAFAGEATRVPAISYDVRQTPDSELVSESQSEYWMQGYMYPIKDEADEIIEVVLIHEDVSEQVRAKEELLLSEERFRELAENIREVFWLFDWQEQRVLYVSPAYETVWGRPTEDLYANYAVWGNSIHPEDREFADESFMQIAQTGGGNEREYRIVHLDGSVRWVSDRGFAIKGEDGRVLRIAGIAEDITEHKQSEAALRESEEKFRILAEQSPNLIFILQGERVLYANRYSEEITGYKREEMYASDFDFFSLIDSEDRSRVQRTFETHAKKEKVASLEYTLATKDKRTLETIVNLRLFKFNGEIATLCTMADISHQKQVEHKLAHLASHDMLTGLPNRMAFDAQLQQSLALARQNQHLLAIFLLDLDHFKRINDSHGHDLGDKVLQAAGEKLSQLLRKSDTVARIGGDEFIVMLSELEEAGDALVVAQKVLTAFRKPFPINNHEFTITTSLGLTLYPNDGEEIDTLKKNADIALYRAKDAGRDNFQRFSPQPAV